MKLRANYCRLVTARRFPINRNKLRNGRHDFFDDVAWLHGRCWKIVAPRNRIFEKTTFTHAIPVFVIIRQS